jgi:hypothetical protein
MRTMMKSRNMRRNAGSNLSLADGLPGTPGRLLFYAEGNPEAPDDDIAQELAAGLRCLTGHGCAEGKPGGSPIYGVEFNLNLWRKTSMKKMLIAIAVAGILVGCGEQTKEAAKDTARSAGKLAVTAVSEAAKATAEVASDAAKATADAAKAKAAEVKDSAVAKAGELKDSAVAKAAEAKDSAVAKAKETVKAVADSVAKGVK